jgi:hypothetical protein
MAMQGRHLNRTQVLTWNESWTTRDGVWITAALDASRTGMHIPAVRRLHRRVAQRPPSPRHLPGLYVVAGWRVDQGLAAGPVP